MKKFQEKRKIKGILYSIGTVIILAGIVFWLGGAALDVYEKAKVTKDRRLDALSELEELQKTEEELRARIEALKSGRGLEEEIRKKFDVAKEGEHAIKIIDTSDTQDENTIQTEEISWWKRLFFWE